MRPEVGWFAPAASCPGWPSITPAEIVAAALRQRTWSLLGPAEIWLAENGILSVLRARHRLAPIRHDGGLHEDSRLTFGYERRSTAKDDSLATVAFISPKGGAGKTTAALLLALGLNARGRKVAIIDSDPNKPLVHWAEMPGCPQGVSIHPAPSMHDVPAALREARRKEPDWVILDTEGSIRGALAFTALRLDMIITPLAGSQLEADQALVASQLVRQHGMRAGHPMLHRALLTRVPAALRPKNLKHVIDQLREQGMELLPTALIEKEAFRALFAHGGGLDQLTAHEVGGIDAAKANAEAYVDAVLDTLAAAKAPPPPSPPPPSSFGPHTTLPHPTVIPPAPRAPPPPPQPTKTTQNGLEPFRVRDGIPSEPLAETLVQRPRARRTG